MIWQLFLCSKERDGLNNFRRKARSPYEIHHSLRAFPFIRGKHKEPQAGVNAYHSGLAELALEQPKLPTQSKRRNPLQELFFSFISLSPVTTWGGDGGGFSWFPFLLKHGEMMPSARDSPLQELILSFNRGGATSPKPTRLKI